jgi:hypothetical protein
VKIGWPEHVACGGEMCTAVWWRDERERRLWRLGVNGRILSGLDRSGLGTVDVSQGLLMWTINVTQGCKDVAQGLY